MDKTIEKLKREMYQLKRLEMYIVLIRLLFTGFILYMLISQIVIAATTGDSSIFAKIAIIIGAYLINIGAYHIAMDYTNKFYKAAEALFNEKSNETILTSVPDSMDNE